MNHSDVSSAWSSARAGLAPFGRSAQPGMDTSATSAIVNLNIK
jgi:hypothetical protein